MAASKALVSRLLVLALCCWVGDCRQSSAVSESPLLPTDDWHYPAEEASETQALLGSGLHVTELSADSNATGTLTLEVANGSAATLHLPGDQAFGWTLRGFLSAGRGGGGGGGGGGDGDLPLDEWSALSRGITSGAALAVLEFEASRWGFVAFLGPEGRLSPAGVHGGHGMRKGVGRTSELLRPPLDPRLATSAYYSQALADPTGTGPHIFCDAILY